MGYLIFQNQEQSKFHIKSENKNKALEAIKTLVGKGKCEDSEWNSFTQRRIVTEFHFYWVKDNDYKNASTLEKALKAWRWKSGNNDNDDIKELIFEGEKYGDDLILFNVIAPFVENHSCIKMRGEDGELFEWCLQGN